MTLDVYSLIAEGDEISAEAVGIIVRANGRAYRQHYSFHFKAQRRGAPTGSRAVIRGCGAVEIFKWRSARARPIDFCARYRSFETDK
jgi:hypothetical protein